MLDGTSTPTSVSGVFSRHEGARIYRALGRRDWEDVFQAIEEEWPSPDFAAARAALLMLPPRERATRRWQRFLPLLHGPATAALVLGAPPPTRRTPLLDSAREAVRRQRAGDFSGALAAVAQVRDEMERPLLTGFRAEDRQLVRAILACADITTAAMSFSDALTMYERGYAIAREIGDAASATACASGLAFVHALTGRSAARDRSIARATRLSGGESEPAHEPMFLSLARIIRAADNLDLVGAGQLYRSAQRSESSALDLALRIALVDGLDARRDLAETTAVIDAAERVTPQHVRATALSRSSLTAVRSRLLSLAGRVQVARDVLRDADRETTSDDGRTELASMRAAAELACGHIEEALRFGYLATRSPALARSTAIGAAVIAACLVEQRHPDAPSSCARAISLADENRLPSALLMLPARRLDAVLSFAGANSPSLRRIAEVRRGGNLRVLADIDPARISLSTHELTVLRHLAKGLSSGRAAMTMHLSVNTVRTHMRHLYRKLGVSTRAEMVRAAREHGLL